MSSSSSATSRENGSHERPPAISASAASDSGSSPEIASSTNRPLPDSLPAVTRPTQPFTARASHASTSGETDSDACFSSTPFTYGAVASARGAHHSFACQSNRRPGIERTASTMSEPVREREHHGLLAVVIEPQLDVVDRVSGAHANASR